MKFLNEQQALESKQRLEEEMNKDIPEELKEFTTYDINWRDKFKTWEECKNFMVDGFSNFNTEELGKLFFIAHNKDKIIGKPQLIHETIQRITIINKTLNIKKSKSGEEYITQYKFIDDRIDKRYDGRIMDQLCLDFWVYKIIYEGREYFLMSKDKLGNEVYEFSGMRIYMNDFSELNKSLSINTIANVFIVKEADSFVKTISKEELISLTKEKEMTEQSFNDSVFLHDSGNVYEYTSDFNILRKAQLLSSKYEGYPLHIFKMGPVGTGKTTEAEVLDYKFKEEQGILEASNSTLKSLVPSFKEKPANLGYICKCNRFAIIDEMMKMVESSMSHDSSRLSNYFGQMNMLLEHKNRMVGSGNDNSVRVQATAKMSITTNNINKKWTINRHLEVIDKTTLSRMLIWVQDYEEISKIYNKEVKNPPHIETIPPKLSPVVSVCSCSTYDCLYVGGISGNDFLTIYDSCQEFLIEFDFNRCKKIFDTITKMINTDMIGVWRSRGLHHTILLLDGITKLRCLFKDYDSKFLPEDDDYYTVERILAHMVIGWNTSYQPEILNRELAKFTTQTQ